MKSRKKTNQQQSFLMQGLEEICDPRQALCKLSKAIPWQVFEEAFEDYYSDEGRPAKPIRLMVGLLLLKQLENLSDEVVVERWTQNPYHQLFCGMNEFQWEFPCDPSDLVYFRKRIGEEGAALILSITAQLHGERRVEKEVIVDTTVQEKNITYPTDTKLYRKIINRCWKLADSQGVRLRRRYSKEVKEHVMAQRFRKHPGKRKAAHKGQRRLKTIAGTLMRELERKLPEEVAQKHAEDFKLYRKVLDQKPQDKEKVYSLHEPQVYCVAKGKEHKKYEFGSKASVAMTRESGVIVGAMAHEKNVYDGHTLPEVLELIESIMGKRPSKVIVDRGYRGRKQIEGTEVMIPNRGSKNQSRSTKTRMRKRFRRRAAIEPVIGHLKHDFRLLKCFLKGSTGDSINLLLACSAWNLKKLMREVLFVLIRMLQSGICRA